TDDENQEQERSKETSIFSLLHTVSYMPIESHPLHLLLKKTKNVNLLHHKTNRTPLLESIFLNEPEIARLLIEHESCDISMATSKVQKEEKMTPLILSSKKHLWPTVCILLKHKGCDLTTTDTYGNQTLHYLVQDSQRSPDMLHTLELYIDIMKRSGLTSTLINSYGNHNRTPLHVAIYHNRGTTDATTDVEKKLIDNGGDLFAHDNLGNIPLHN
ncbi:unnamed protein product, partial [Didymodactylos carnosus]